MIKISEQCVRINMKEYELLDEWINSPNPYDFSLNHFYSSGGNGDGRISLGKEYDRFESFFDLEVDVNSYLANETLNEFEQKNFVILKKDLDKYLSKAKYKFNKPLNEDIFFGEAEENYKGTKIKIKEDFETLKVDFESFNEAYEFKMCCLLDSYDELWIRHENAHQNDYKILRKMTIPSYSYFSIFKLKNNEEIIYYMKLCYKNDKMIPEILEEDLKDLEIVPNTIKQMCALF